MRSAQARTLLGDRMRELRESAGVSLTWSAQSSGWSKSHLSRVEQGATRPSLPLIEWYDAAFGARGALVHQYLELDAAVRQTRLLTLRELRGTVTPAVGSVDAAVAGDDPGGVLAGGGAVPADYDPRDRSVFVRETIPDGTVLEPAQRFLKSWTVRNAGPVPWRERHLTRQGTPGVPGWLRSPMQVPIPATDPGEETAIVVPMCAPATAGMCTAYFKITDQHGRLYFPRSDVSPLYCTVLIPS
jgi:transcriptional regulator with XRE-family HTH domain